MQLWVPHPAEELLLDRIRGQFLALLENYGGSFRTSSGTQKKTKKKN